MNTATTQVAAKCQQPASPHLVSQKLFHHLVSQRLFHPPGQPTAVPPPGQPELFHPPGRPKPFHILARARPSHPRVGTTAGPTTGMSSLWLQETTIIFHHSYSAMVRLSSDLYI